MGGEPPVQVRLVGTGDLAGLPRPACRCLRCRAALGPAGSRRPAGVELDAALLLDGPPDGGRADIRRVASHPDDPDRLGPGEQLVVDTGAGRYHLRSLAAGREGQGLLLVTAPGGATLIWAPHGGDLPAETLRELTGYRAGWAAVGVGTVGEGAPEDVGRHAGARGPRPWSAAGWALARLRAVDAVADSCVTALVGIGHDWPDDGELAIRTARWGTRLIPDGGLLTRPDGAQRGQSVPLRTLVLGGTGSGKSALAEDLLAAEPRVCYLATGGSPERQQEPPDPSWQQRVQRHRDRRPAWWTTVESTDIPAALSEAVLSEAALSEAALSEAALGEAAETAATTATAVLLDSVGSWLAAALETSGAWTHEPGWRHRYAAHRDALLTAWRQTPVPVVAVTEEVGLSLVAGTDSGRLFADELGRLNQLLAAQSERVLMCIAGRTAMLAGEAGVW